MTAKILRFPKRQSAVESVIEATMANRGPRELMVSKAYPGAVRVQIAGVELWLTPDEAEEVAEDWIELAADARERSGK